MRARCITIPICLLLAVSGIQLTSATTSGAASCPQSAELPENCSQPAGPTSGTFVKGTVRNGTTAVAGAAVTVSAWPDTATLASLADGADVSLVTLGRTTTNSTGGYSISYNFASLDATYRESNGDVSVQVTADGPEQSMSWNLTVSAVGGRPDAPAVAIPAWRPNTVDIDLGTASTVTDSLHATRPEVDAESSTQTEATDDSETATGSTKVARDVYANDPDTTSAQSFPSGADTDGGGAVHRVCHAPKASGWQYGRPEAFANVYAWAGAPATVTETESSWHELGIAVSINGGAFSADGSATASMHAGGSVTRTYSTNQQIRNSVNYRKYTQYCPSGHYQKAHTKTYLRPAGIASLQTANRAGGSEYWTNSGCITVSDGAYRKTKGENVTYRGGVSLLGVSVSAQSGWDRETVVEWNVNAPTRLCGSSARGWLPSSQAGARSVSQPPSHGA